MTLGLITARGGSKRIPKKNVRIFCGHPLVAWSIMQSRCSGLIDETYLTTDDDEIADIGELYGAKIVRRPVYDDDISAGHVLKEAVEKIEAFGYNFDKIFSLLPTSPLKKVNDIDNMIHHFNAINEGRETKIQEMEWFSPEKECYIYENMTEMKGIYNVPLFLKKVIADKSWKYSKYTGGYGIANKQYLLEKWTKLPSTDTAMDNNLDILLPEMVLGYAMEPWQCNETDYDYSFKACELLMDEFILHGRGMNVYTDYARKFGKIIQIP